MEVFTYGQAGMDGYGGSSYIDDIVCRERDITTNGSFDDRYYYLQNWRNDVVAIMNYDGAIKERMFYDAYGRPHCFSPGDLKGGGGSGNDRPDGLLNASDTWTTGSAAWNKDIGNASGLAEPDGVVDANDGTTLTNLKAAGFSGGYGILSSSAVGNRKGYAGYEFDTVLNGAAGVDEKPVYHVRHRVLAADTGKWMQKDPLGYHDGMDLYEYCQSDAVDKVDAMGLAQRSSCCGSLAVIQPDDNLNRRPDDWTVAPPTPNTPVTSPSISPADPCAATIRNLLADPEVAALLLKLAAKCGGRQLEIRSRDCGDPDSGSTSCLTRIPTITLCKNPGSPCPSVAAWKDTLIHELTHFGQLCEMGCWAFTVTSCKTTVKMEIEAYCAEPLNRIMCQNARNTTSETRCRDARTICLLVEGSAPPVALGDMLQESCGRLPFEGLGRSNAFVECMNQFNCPHGLRRVREY